MLFQYIKLGKLCNWIQIQDPLSNLRNSVTWKKKKPEYKPCDFEFEEKINSKYPLRDFHFGWSHLRKTKP